MILNVPPLKEGCYATIQFICYIIADTQCRDHITPVLCKLRQRVKFVVACLVHQLLSVQAPLNLVDDCCLVSDSTRRSAVS